MNLDQRRRQLIYRANHRGIKEMDILLGGFARANAAELKEHDLAMLESIMNESDRDLLMWFTGEKPVPAHLDTEIFNAILAHQKRSF
jgi:antitoxin CptB